MKRAARFLRRICPMLLKWSCAAGFIFVIQLFLPLPLNFSAGSFDGPWHLSRHESESWGDGREFHLRTPLWEFAHTWGDASPFCGIYRSGWCDKQKALAFITKGYGVVFRIIK